MRVVRTSLLLFTLAAAFALLAGVMVTAQPATVTCPEVVTSALESVGSLCAGQARNSACYGNTLVRASFVDAAADAFFENEGDVINLNLVESIETSPYNDPELAWGVSVLSVQASLPGALPGQNAMFLLLGGAQIENAVTSASAFTPAQPVPVTVAFSAALLEQPDAASATMAVLSPGQPLLADAQNADNAFVRVTFGESFGWVGRALLQPDPAIAELPAYTPGASFGPMQAFFLRTGIGGVQCAQAPSALMVQGPENLTVEINANGADIAFGSTIVLRTLSTEDAKAQGLTKQTDQNVSGVLEVSVIDGEAVVQNLGGGTTTIGEGEWSAICLTEPENLGVDGQANDQVITGACGGWTDPEPVSQEFLEQFGLVDDFVLNYPVDVFTATPQPPTFTPVASQTMFPTTSPPTAVPPTAVPPTAIPPTAVPPSAAPPTNTPTPTLTATPVTGADLQIAATAALTPSLDVQGVPRFLGAGVTGSPWDLQFDITLTNNGPEDASEVEVSGIFPEGIEGSYETDAGDFDYQSNTWLVGDMAVGQIVNFTGYGFVFLDCGGSVSAILTVTSATPDPFPGAGSYSAIADCGTPTPTTTPTGLGADISIAGFYQSTLELTEGEEVCFTISLLNDGPDDAYDTAVSDLLPAGLTFSSFNATHGSYSIAWNIWSLSVVISGETPSTTICATADEGTAGETLATLAVLTANNDNSATGNAAAWSVDVLPLP